MGAVSSRAVSNRRLPSLPSKNRRLGGANKLKPAKNRRLTIQHLAQPSDESRTWLMTNSTLRTAWVLRLTSHRRRRPWRGRRGEEGERINNNLIKSSQRLAQALPLLCKRKIIYLKIQAYSIIFPY